MTRTPASLLERLRQPFDAEAWSRFVSLYTPMIYSWACRARLQEQDALDLVQEVFVILLRVLPTFSYDRDRSFRRWLRTVTLNTWRNGRKRAGNRVLHAAADADQVAVPDELEDIWESEYREHVVSLLITADDRRPEMPPDLGPHLHGAPVNGLSVASIRGARHAILLVSDLQGHELTHLSTAVSVPLVDQLLVSGQVPAGSSSIAALSPDVTLARLLQNR